MSDGMRAFRGGDSGNNDLQATDDPDGTTLFARDGNDILRGRRGNDILDGGGGDDQMFGGGGADQFRFFGSRIDGPSDTDFIRDLTFADGDTLVLGDFGAGTFSDAEGVNAFGPAGSNDGSAAVISSFEGIVNAAAGSTNVTAFRQSQGNNNLVFQITDADGQIQNIVITGGYSQFIAAGGSDGL
jgi:Ca2+-binding RTX toxin-like protein